MHEDILIVAIDDETIEYLEDNLPYCLNTKVPKRKFIAKLIEDIAGLNPKVIIVDFLFSMPLPESENQELIDITKKHNNIVHCFSFENIWPTDLGSNADSTLTKFAIKEPGYLRRKSLFAYKPEKPFRNLLEASSHLGYVDIVSDPKDNDKILGVPLTLNYNRDTLPALGLVALSIYFDSEFSIDSTRIEFVKNGETKAEIQFDNHVFPIIDFLPSEIIRNRDTNYLPVSKILPSSPPDSFESLSFLPKLTARDNAKDKIVLIGSTAGNEDSHATSNEKYYPGMFVQAGIMNTILQHRVLKLISWGDSVLAAMTLIALFLIFQKLRYAKAWIVYPAVVLIFLAIVNSIGIVSYFQGLKIDIALSNTAILLAFIVSIIKFGFIERLSEKPAYLDIIKSEVGAISSDLKRNQVFISYSRHDKSWLQRLQIMLKPLERNHIISVWDDTKVEPGTEWEKELEDALNSAKVAVLLVSPTYLASDFIMNYELVSIFKAAEEEGLIIIWIPVSSSMYKETALADYQAVIDPLKPLDKLTPAKRKEQLVYIGNKIKKAIESRPDRISY